MDAMKKANPKAVWVVQGWTENPRPEMMKALNPGDLLILDLFSECRPMWGIPSIWKRDKGYEEHNWLFCLLENFGERGLAWKDGPASSQFLPDQEQSTGRSAKRHRSDDGRH